MRAVIYHNPRCSKSRATLALLHAHGVDLDIVDYLAQPPSIDTLRTLLRGLGLPPQAIVRFGEARATELGVLASDTRSAAEWLQLLHENPILIERPIVIIAGRATLGRPPENVLRLLPVA